MIQIKEIVRTLIACLVIMFTLPSQGQSNRTERKILQSVDSKNVYYTALLKEVVNINSGTMNLEGVKTVGLRLKFEFEKLGMETEWQDGSSWNRAGHLVARIRGGHGPKILLIGHLDTVFEPDSPFQEYEMLNDSIMKGPGVADMKGGDVIILAALSALKEVGVLSKMNIEVVLTGDEEKSGRPIELSKKAITEAAEWADIALAFENADGDPKTIVTTRRGSQSWTLKVKGNAAHSSQVFTEAVGTGAVYEASRILNEFYKKLPRDKNLTFNPGLILGGTDVQHDPGQNQGSAFGKNNVVAQDVVAAGDLRAVSVEQLAKAKQTMLDICKDNYPGASAELIFKDGGYPPLTETDGNIKLLELYSQVSMDLGYGVVTAVDPRNAGAADVSFTAGLVDMAIDGLGLSGDHDHTINEYGNLNYLPVKTKRAAVLMYRLYKQ